MRIEFTLDSTKVTKNLSGMVKGLSDYSKPLQAAGKDLLLLFGTEVFETQGKAIGENWRRLAASTLAMRAARRGYYAQAPVATDKILVWTGRLRSGFRQEVKQDTLRIFNIDPKFPYHQTPSGRPAQRKMLALTSRVVTIAVDRINEYIEKIINV